MICDIRLQVSNKGSGVTQSTYVQALGRVKAVKAPSSRYI